MLNRTRYYHRTTIVIVAIDTMTSRPARPQTPYQVLRLLPKDATPAQQDSAIQAWFEPERYTIANSLTRCTCQVTRFHAT